MPVDYQQGRIYAIRAPSTDDVYIGSTCVPLSRRLAGHRGNYHDWKAGKRDFISSFKLLEREGYYIELVELFPCNSKEELNRREGEVIRATANCVNMHVAGRTDAEYYADNREKILEKAKQYQETHKEARRAYLEENKEALNEQSLKWRNAHREELNEKQKQYYATHIEAIKEKKQLYRETHKEEIAKYNQQYRETHKEELKEKRRLKAAPAAAAAKE